MPEESGFSVKSIKIDSQSKLKAVTFPLPIEIRAKSDGTEGWRIKNMSITLEFDANAKSIKYIAPFNGESRGRHTRRPEDAFSMKVLGFSGAFAVLDLDLQKVILGRSADTTLNSSGATACSLENFEKIDSVTLIGNGALETNLVGEPET